MRRVRTWSMCDTVIALPSGAIPNDSTCSPDAVRSRTRRLDEVSSPGRKSWTKRTLRSSSSGPTNTRADPSGIQRGRPEAIRRWKPLIGIAVWNTTSPVSTSLALTSATRFSGSMAT